MLGQVWGLVGAIRVGDRIAVFCDKIGMGLARFNSPTL